jgi:hypothetical protein
MLFRLMLSIAAAAKAAAPPPPPATVDGQATRTR